jgi:hypothetical protein
VPKRKPSEEHAAAVRKYEERGLDPVVAECLAYGDGMENAARRWEEKQRAAHSPSRMIG